MTGFEVFYYIILPITIAAIGWAAAVLHERPARHGKLHPGE